MVFCLFMLAREAFSQKADFRIPDSLSNKNYEFYIDRLENDDADSRRAAIYSKAYLAKAKAEHNWKEMVGAYKAILHQSDNRLRLVYADSMISAAKKDGNRDLVGSAFLTKGIVYYDLKEHSKALDNYITANDYISGGGNEYLEYKIKFHIAEIKYYLGFYPDATILFQSCVNYFKAEERDVPYLSSLHSLGLCYNKIGKFQFCSNINKLGISEAIRIRKPDAIAHFTHSEGVNQYFLKNYTAAIKKLDSCLPALITSKDFANETVAYFYLGKSYWKLNQREKAVSYFLKVDKAFMDSDYIKPDLRENYELLIDYYKSRNDGSKELLYINRLLKADRFLEKHYKYLTGKIYKEYDTKSLLIAKNQVEKSLEFRKAMDVILYIVIALLLVVLLFLTYRYFENQKIYKKKFEELMNQKELPKVSEKKEIKKGELDINPDVIASVLKHIDKFEATKKYLDKDMNLTKLATIFESNSKYVSLIIAFYKGKKSIDYINDLKIDYIINLLKTDNRYKHYTNKALGEECGFSTTQHFTRAFTSRTGISPTYFVQELKKIST